MHRPSTLVLAVVLAALGGCGDSDAQGFRVARMPSPAHFVAGVQHPLFPLPVGATWVYRGRTSEGVEEITVTVLPETRVVDGVTATVVHDRATLDGRLTEDTHDWFAQDDVGSVWYLGEATTSYGTDGSTSTAGSWEAGVHGASAGIQMPATPKVGDRYQQELLSGVAEDRGEIVALDATGEVPFGAFTGALRTRDTTPLEPDQVEYKYYVRGVGVVLEEEGDERLELVSYQPHG